MPSFIPRIGLVPGFPEFTGPHKVGSIDVEFPISELHSPSPPPFDGQSPGISTVQYRIFYPCNPEAKSKSVSWLPQPQRGYINAYTKFLGAGSTLANCISYIPTYLPLIDIPVQKNVPLLKPRTLSKRWPVMIFCHGLGGTRNSYSHLVGLIASHGVIVVTPEHRDGSTPVSYIRDVPLLTETDKHARKKIQKTVQYLHLPHTASSEVEAGRNAQLKIRLWELGLIHDSLLKLDRGERLTNINSFGTSLNTFRFSMDVHRPGGITFAGHSFGAATITQFVKSTFYSERNAEAPTSYEPLFTPSSRSSIVKQITPYTSIILLDIWCFPLRAKSVRWLWDLPFPSYSTPSSPGGAVLLAVGSQAFYKWRAHLNMTKKLLSPYPSAMYNYGAKEKPTWIEPHLFYATASAHISQSDFGILFPWFMKKIMGSEEPERVMKLNVRAILQFMRNQKIPVSPTSATDMELDCKQTATTEDDIILGTHNEVRGWNRICMDLDD